MSNYIIRLFIFSCVYYNLLIYMVLYITLYFMLDYKFYIELLLIYIVQLY